MIIKETAGTPDNMEEMRSAMQGLRSSLSNYQIFSDNAVRKVMAARNSWLENMLKLEKFVVVPFVALIFLVLTLFTGLSWWFYGVTLLMVVADVIWDQKINNVCAQDIMHLPLMDLEAKILRRRRDFRQQMLVEVPVLVLWIFWFCYEFIPESLRSRYSVTSWEWWAGSIGLCLISLIAVFLIYHKIKSTDTEALRELQDYKKL